MPYAHSGRPVGCFLRRLKGQTRAHMDVLVACPGTLTAGFPPPARDTLIHHLPEFISTRTARPQYRQKSALTDSTAVRGAPTVSMLQLLTLAQYALSPTFCTVNRTVTGVPARSAR